MNEFRNAYERGCLLFEQCRYELATREFRAALTLEPGSAETHAMLAISLSCEGCARAGIKEAEESIRLAPDFAYAHYALARAASVLMNFETPKEALDFPIKINRIVPNWASVKALRAAEEALRLDPTDPDYFARLAYLKVWSWDWKEGLELAERGLAIQPTGIGCIHARILALTGLGRQAEAQAGLKYFAEHHPNHPVVHELAGLFKVHNNQLGAAQEHLLESLRIDPNSVETQRALGRARNLEILRGHNPRPADRATTPPELEPAMQRACPKWIKLVVVALILVAFVLLVFKLQLVATSFQR